jgi:hypothetical protein
MKNHQSRNPDQSQKSLRPFRNTTLFRKKNVANNLALTILPILHEVFNPPALEKIFENLKTNDEIKRSFKGLHKSMVNAYCVVEVPRSENDPVTRRWNDIL